MSDMRTFINISSGIINKELPPVGPDADVVVETEIELSPGVSIKTDKPGIYKGTKTASGVVGGKSGEAMELANRVLDAIEEQDPSSSEEALALAKKFCHEMDCTDDAKRLVYKQLRKMGYVESVAEAEKKATCGCTSSCNHCEDNHTVDQIGQICECCGNEIKAVNEAAAKCKYCGGNCPNDEEHACDGYLGDIDGLYEASDCDASCPKSCPDCGGTGKAIKKEAVGDFAEPIYDLIDELGDSSIVLDNLIRYLDGDTIKDFVSDFRREHDMNNTEESKDPTSDEEWSKLLKIPNRKSWEKMVKSSKEIDADSINESAYLDKVKKLLG